MTNGISKPMAIRLQDNSGNPYTWVIRRVPRAINCTNGRTRIVSGWEFSDHQGYTRFAEGNWNSLVFQFRLVAENYGLQLRSQLS